MTQALIVQDLFGAPLEMIRELRARAPRVLRTWGQALNLPQAVGGVVFAFEPLGLWILFAWIISMVLAGKIYRYRGLSAWISLCHVSWLPLYPFLLKQALEPENTVYYYWILYVIVTMTISLILDFRAVTRALKGNELLVSERG